MRSRLASIAVAMTVGLAALAGCAGQSTIYNSGISSAYRPYLYGYAAGGRDLRTVVLGNPFGLDQQQMEERLLAKFNARPTLLQRTHFTTDPGPSARPEFKVVLLFNRAIVLPNQVCRAPDQVPVADLGPTMRLTATFCQFGGYLSTVTGELENVSDIDDPRFERLVEQIVPLLFPPIDPTRDDEKRFLITKGACRWDRIPALGGPAPAPCDHLAVDVGAQRLGGPPRAHRPRREAAEAQQPIVHHDRAGGREVDAEAGRDPHHVRAARQHRGRQRAALGTENVGGIQRMAEAREQGRLVEQLDADQGAALG